MGCRHKERFKGYQKKKVQKNEDWPNTHVKNLDLKKNGFLRSQRENWWCDGEEWDKMAKPGGGWDGGKNPHLNELTGSSIATATKRSYIAPSVFNPCDNGFKYNCRITWHFVWFYGWWSKPDFWWSKSTSFNWGLFREVGFRIKSEKSILPIFNFFMWDTKIICLRAIAVGPVLNLWSILEICSKKNLKTHIFLQNYEFLLKNTIFLFFKYECKDFILHHC